MDSPQRRTSLLLLGSNTLLPLMLLFVAFNSRSASKGEGLPLPLAYGIGLAALAAAAIYATKKLVDSAEAVRFRTDMLIALAFSEFASLIGFVRGLALWTDCVPFVAGTIVVNLLFIAPRVSAYYR